MVTPYAGVWIEIFSDIVNDKDNTSLPTRECGLKFHVNFYLPFRHRHSLRGSVD